MSPTRTTTLSFTRPMARKSSRQSMTGFDFGISLGTGKFAGPSSGKTSIVSPRSLLTAGSWPRAVRSTILERTRAIRPSSSMSLPQASKPRRSQCKKARTSFATPSHLMADSWPRPAMIEDRLTARLSVSGTSPRAVR